MSTYIDAFYGADTPVTSSDNLVWKEILREGELKHTPTDKGMLPVPFRVTKDGVSSRKDRTVSMSELVKSFNDGAYEHVQIPLTDEQNKDHKDIARINTGFVRQLKTVDGSDGKARLVAGLEFTEPEVKGKCERGTIANSSSGIYFDRVRPHDGAKFPVALRHVALTNTPFMNDLTPFGSHFSEADDGGDENKPEEIIALEMSDDAIWQPNESLNVLRENVERALSDLTNSTNPHGLVGDDNAKFFYARDIATTKALVSEEPTGNTFVIPFKKNKDSVELSPQTEWVEAQQQWIAASEGSVMHEQGKSAYQTFLSDNQDKNDKSAEEVETIEASEVTETSTKPKRDLTTPYGRLAAAREDRESRVLLHNEGKSISSERSRMAKLDITSLNLSDEEKGQIESLQAENAELKKGQHKDAVDAEITRVSALGLAEHSGFLKTYRRLLLADDGDVAAVLLSEDGDSTETISLTDAVKSLIDALPRNTDKTRIVLSEQALLSETGDKPAAEGEEDHEETHEDKVTDARAKLKL